MCDAFPNATFDADILFASNAFEVGLKCMVLVVPLDLLTSNS